MNKNTQTIVLGGGCFWCTEAVFKMINGVEKVEPGYAGGWIENPGYKQVSGGSTGHAEVIKVDFDPNKVSLKEILEIFFEAHDPTTLNRQGNDVGEQYRSIILYIDKEQKKTIKDFIEEIQKNFKQKIVTEVKELEKFYPAEDYHHDYYEKNKNAPYCKLVISPKLEKLKKKIYNS